MRMLLRSTLFVAVALGTAACHDAPPTAPRGGNTPSGLTVARVVMSCSRDQRSGLASCVTSASAPLDQAASGRIRADVVLNPDSVPLMVILGGNSFDPATGILSLDISVRNRYARPIGTPDRTTVTGVKVFYEQTPFVLAGSGAVDVVNADGVGTFTAPGQPFYAYPQIVPAGGESARKRWQWRIAPTVQSWQFVLDVWANIAPLAPPPGKDIVVFNDFNLFDETGMQFPSNVTLVTNLVTFTSAGPRSAGTVALFDYGRSSVCFGTGECGVARTATMRTTIAAAGLTVSTISSTSGSITSIPANVKVMFLWNPTIAYTTAEINVFKQFANEGGRLVYVGEYAAYYGVGIQVENALLLRMGAVMTNIGDAVDCGYNDLPQSSLRPNQITAGMTGIRIACASVIVPGPNDFIFLYDHTNTRALAGVAAIDVTPLAAIATAEPDRLRQAQPAILQSSDPDLVPTSSTGRMP